MKIKVGKTYKDGSGRQWLVEAKLINASDPDKNYLITTQGGGYNFCGEDGVSFLNYPQCDLLPNRVKREAWGYRYEKFPAYIYLYDKRGNTFTEESLDAYIKTGDVSGGGTKIKVKSIWYEDEE